MPRILAIVRSNSILERVCAVVDSLHGEFDFTVYSVVPKGWLKNRRMHAILGAAGLKVLDYTDINSGARLAASLKSVRPGRLNPLTMAGKAVNWTSKRFTENSIHGFLENLRHDLLIIDYVSRDLGSEEFDLIYDDARRRGIPILVLMHGSNLIYPAPGTLSPSQLLLYSGDYLFAVFADDFEHNIRPYIGPCRKTFTIGDPRYTRSFVRKLYDSLADKPVAGNRDIALLGGTLGHLGISDNEQDEATFKLVQRLRKIKPDSRILYKYHPYVPWTDFKTRIRETPGVISYGEETDSSLIVARADLVISAPSSVLLESMVLGKRLAMLDFPYPASKVVKPYARSGVHVLRTVELETFDPDAVKPFSDEPWLLEHVYGGVAGQTPIGLFRSALREILQSTRQANG